MPEKELEDVERNLGVTYQLVTDETSMIVLSDQVFAERGIERRNQRRVAVERAAQVHRAQQPVQNYTVSRGQSTFPSHTPRIGGGGGRPFERSCSANKTPRGFGGGKRGRSMELRWH